MNWKLAKRLAPAYNNMQQGSRGLAPSITHLSCDSFALNKVQRKTLKIDNIALTPQYGNLVLFALYLASITHLSCDWTRYRPGKIKIDNIALTEQCGNLVLFALYFAPAEIWLATAVSASKAMQQDLSVDASCGHRYWKECMLSSQQIWANFLKRNIILCVSSGFVAKKQRAAFFQ